MIREIRCIMLLLERDDWCRKCMMIGLWYLILNKFMINWRCQELRNNSISRGSVRNTNYSSRRSYFVINDYSDSNHRCSLK
jgi:hypothetical protein